MTLEIIYYLSQIFAVVAIVATLIAILYQGWQTNRIARADLTLSMWMQTGQMQTALFDTVERADFMHRALYVATPLTEAEKNRLNTCLSLAIGTHEAAFNLRRRNLVEAAAYNRNEETTRLYLTSPRVRKWWARSRERGYDPAFRDLVDAMVKGIESAEAAAPKIQEKSA